MKRLKFLTSALACCILLCGTAGIVSATTNVSGSSVNTPRGQISYCSGKNDKSHNDRPNKKGCHNDHDYHHDHDCDHNHDCHDDVTPTPTSTPTSTPTPTDTPIPTPK